MSHTLRHKLVAMAVITLLALGIYGMVVPVAAEEPQAGVVHDTSSSTASAIDKDDPSDRYPVNNLAPSANVASEPTNAVVSAPAVQQVSPFINTGVESATYIEDRN